MKWTNRALVMCENWRKSACCALAMLLFCSLLLMGKPVLAAELILPNDATDIVVSGEKFVWLQSDARGVRQVYYGNQVTGEIKALTDSAALKDAPSIHGSLVVWADKTGHDPDSMYWDIYSYNVESGKLKKLNDAAGAYANPRTNGKDVVWFDTNGYGELFYYDAEASKSLSLGEGRFPVIAGESVLFKNARDGGLSQLSLRSGAIRSIVALGAPHYVDWFVTNGENVLWKQKDGTGASKYVLISLQDSSSVALDLTPMTVQPYDYAFMEMGETKAVFIVEEGGNAVVKGVDLASGAISTVHLPISEVKLLGFEGDSLVYQSREGNLATTSIQITDQAGGRDDSHQRTTDTVELTERVSKRIGANGGTLVSSYGQATLVIAPQTFEAETEVSLNDVPQENPTFLDAVGHSLKVIQGSWEIEAVAPFSIPARLTITVSDEWIHDIRKLAIYYWEPTEQTWTYVESKANPTEQSVTGVIDQSGKYALMLRSVQFDDVDASHWASTAIETLAAHHIIDGISTHRFAPHDTLTRAQFAKLLVSASHLSLDEHQTIAFHDVPHDAWYAGSVQAAADAGIVKGSGGYFYPNDPITREQMITMLVRATGQSLPTMSEDLAAQVLEGNSDGDQVSDWAKASIAAAVEDGLVLGDQGRLLPKKAATRAEAAMLLLRWMERLGRI